MRKIIYIFIFFPILLSAEEDSLRYRYLISLKPVLSVRGGQAPGQNFKFYDSNLGYRLRLGIESPKYHWRAGAELMHFVNFGEGRQSLWFYMGGIYGQFNLTPKKRNRLFVEPSLYTSNMCRCIPGNPNLGYTPLQQAGIFYVGMEAGWDIYLSPFFDFRLHYAMYWLINPIPAAERRWPYPPSIGITYYFQKRDKPKPAKKEKQEVDLRKVKEKNNN